MEKFLNFFTPKVIAISAAAVAATLILGGIFSGAFSGPTAQPTAVSTPTVIITPAPEPTIPASTPAPTPTEVVVEELYEDCAAVWVALGRPITADDEGYPEETPNKFDLDSDGIGCEDNPATPEDESQIDWQAIWTKTKGNAEEFAEWAGPKLKDFWTELLAPSLTNTWERLKSNF